MLRRLALPEDDLREPLSYRAVVVNLGEVEVFVGQIPEARNHLVNAQVALAQLVEYGAKPGLFDGDASLYGQGGNRRVRPGKPRMRRPRSAPEKYQR